MNKAAIKRDALALPTQERLEVAEALLDSLGEDLPLHPWQRDILVERVAAAQREPDAFSSWEEIRDRVERRLMSIAS